MYSNNYVKSSKLSQIGDGEKMVRALFAVARCYQPAVIFIDEIDSLLTQRSDNEHEATRRIKNEFLIQWDGAGTNKDDQLLLVGATNRPHELDEAARRRLVKRVYIPLPDPPARTELVKNLLRKQDNSLTAEDVERVVQQTNGYSGADLHALCSEAALGPLRALRSKGQVNSPPLNSPIFYYYFFFFYGLTLCRTSEMWRWMQYALYHWETSRKL